jgi:hypothetical protein
MAPSFGMYLDRINLSFKIIISRKSKMENLPSFGKIPGSNILSFNTIQASFLSNKV